MSDTIILMESDYRLVDVLNADQLEVGDLIGLGDEVVEVIEIVSLKDTDGFALTYQNEFGEKDIVDVGYDERFELFFYI